MSPYTAAAGQFGDTTYTKIFVGGLAWETQKDSMRNYFEQFGEILEAVVITDKNSGRSKGYGFVTFREADAARRACVDPSPVIDGRKTNCNLASLGLQKSRPATPLHGGSKNFRNMKSFQGAGMQGGMETALPSLATFPHYAIHQGIPYNVYGYSLYPTEYAYPANYYNIHGEAANQYQVFGGATTGTISGANAFYPYFQFGQGYRVQQPQILQYSSGAAVAGVTGFAVSQQYGRPISVAPTAAVQAGMTMDPTAPNQSTPSTMAHHYRLIPTHFNATPILEQPLA